MGQGFAEEVLGYLRRVGEVVGGVRVEGKGCKSFWLFWEFC